MGEGSSHQRVYGVFRDALEQPPKSRAAFVAAADLDERERSLVGSLLEADQANEDDPPQPDWGTGADELLEDLAARAPGTGSMQLAGQKIGPYSLQSELGRGGMGVVYLALQERTNRLVALKCLVSMLSGENLVKRFEQEIEILGSLDHPGIAKVFDAGTHELEGKDIHFFAMEYVHGLNLSEFALKEELELPGKLELLASICSAVHHAHEQGVIHRDLKPANIIVTADGQPKVLDFGISRFIDRDVQLTTLSAEEGRLIGTLSYMSPEQAGGDQGEVGKPSDVYALGVIGFELICGRLPHDLGAHSLLSAARVIREESPKSVRDLRGDLPIDVDTIIGKALESDPARRYSSAEAMADDLRRFLRHEPIQARPPSTLYVAFMFTRRHRALVGSSVAIFITLLAALIFSLNWALAAEDARLTAEWSGYRMSLDLAESDLREGSLASAQDGLAAVPAELRGWEWRLLDRRTARSRAELEGHWLLVWSVALSPDGSTAYSCSGDGSVRSWNTRTGAAQAVVEDHLERVFSVAVSPGGTFLASGSDDVHLRDAATLETLAEIGGHSGAVHGLCYSRDGAVLASGDGAGNIRLSDGRDGRLLRELASCGHAVWEFGFLPDGERMVSGCGGGEVRLWRTETGEELALGDSEAGGVYALDVHPAGELIAIGCEDGSLKLLNAETLGIVGENTLHTASIFDLVYASGGDLIITSSKDHSIRVWDATTLEPRARLVGHTGAVASLAYSAETRTLLSGSWDQTLRLWDDATLMRSDTAYPVAEVIDFIWGPGAGEYTTCSSPGEVVIRSLASGEAISVVSQLPDTPSIQRFLAEGGTGIAHWRIRLEDALEMGAEVVFADGRLVTVEDFAGECGGSLLGTGEFWLPLRDGAVAFFEADTGNQLRAVSNPDQVTFAVAVDADRSWIATAGGAPFDVQVWDHGTLEEVARLPRHSNDIEELEFSPSGRWLVSASEDGTANVWRTGTWEKVAELGAHGAGNVRLAFHPDEERLATVSDAGSVRFWELDSWSEVVAVRLPANAGAARRIEFSPSGDQLFVGMESGLHLLDIR